MYIARRTGGGRGVYEIAGATATGLTSADLLGRELVFDFPPNLRLPSGVVLDVQGGKHRLRMANASIQIQRQLAAALMMPSPRRVNNAGISPQVLLGKSYVIERIHIDFTNHLLPNKAFVVPGLIEARNQAHEHEIQSQQRFATLKRVWKNWSGLPEPLQSLVRKHKRLVTSGQPINVDCEQTVSRIQSAARLVSPDVHQVANDGLSTLTNYLDLEFEAVGVSSVHEASAVEFDLGNIVGVPQRVSRAIIERRGQWSFRQGLLAAYGSRCQITKYTGEPALEAAHIYPYSEGGEFTNDLRNGLLLRSDIHTLFDLGLLKVTPKSHIVRIMDPLSASSYAALDGTVLQTSARLQPSKEALAYKWQQTYT